MPSNLKSASHAEQAAALAAVMPDIRRLIGEYVPYMFQYQILQKLEDPATKAQILAVIDDALNAAEKVRDAPVTPPHA
jgi:Mg/Co/Ni transporter MgtE